MSNDLNACMFIGRAGRDPEQRFSASGMEVTNFSLAVGYKYKETESTEWINVVCFGKLASIVSQYVQKGKQLFVSGRMQTEEWTDKDGNKRKTTKVIANTVQFLGSAADKPEAYKVRNDGPPAEDPEQIPF